MCIQQLKATIIIFNVHGIKSKLQFINETTDCKLNKYYNVTQLKSPKSNKTGCVNKTTCEIEAKISSYFLQQAYYYNKLNIYV